MFWISLVVMYVLSIPVNRDRIMAWYDCYPPALYSVMGPVVSDAVVFKAQLWAIIMFGLYQPIMAAVPFLLVSDPHWYHWLAGGCAAIGFAASGNPKNYLDVVRSSHIMFITVLIVYVGAVHVINALFGYGAMLDMLFE